MEEVWRGLAGPALSEIKGLTAPFRIDGDGNGVADYQMKINGDVTGESGDWLL